MSASVNFCSCKNTVEIAKRVKQFSRNSCRQPEGFGFAHRDLRTKLRRQSLMVSKAAVSVRGSLLNNQSSFISRNSSHTEGMQSLFASVPGKRRSNTTTTARNAPVSSELERVWFLIPTRLLLRVLLFGLDISSRKGR